MPDSFLLSMAMLTAAGAAGAILLLLAWPWRAPQPTQFRLGWVLGVGFGFFAGCGVLDLWPAWPPADIRGRFLTLLLPATLAVEVVAAFPAVPRWLAWLLRLLLAASAAPVLLHGTVYLADLAGPGSREWSPARAALILSALAGGLAAVWGLLALPRSRSSGRSEASALALACAAAGATVMMSGYLTGGQMGLPLAAALGGVVLASFLIARQPDPQAGTAQPSLGFGLVGLFGVLLLGRFFGTLPTNWALGLVFAPLLGWVLELPGLRRLNPRLSAVLRLALVAIPLVIVVMAAQRQFTQDYSTAYSP